VKREARVEVPQDVLDRRQRRRAVADESRDEAGTSPLVRGARDRVQPAWLAGVTELERLGVAQHHAHGDADGANYRFDDRQVRRQPATGEVADELDAPGASLLRFPGIFNRLRDDLDQHAGSV
jgi:hypothetical protein